MLVTHIIPQFRGKEHQEVLEEVLDSGAPLPWWVTSPRENRNPLMPAAPLADAELLLVINTTIPARERHKRYPQDCNRAVYFSDDWQLS